ncbi:hypothetical protein STRDD11_02410 [Streptococcus sp. DD11]|nr:hypothetical protein STRDD11_02410 [Streptococcus sp. DD11]
MQSFRSVTGLAGLAQILRSEKRTGFKGFPVQSIHFLVPKTLSCCK